MKQKIQDKLMKNFIKILWQLETQEDIEIF